MSKTIQARFRVERSAFTLDVDLELPGQGITALFGHSGSGKTTLLRAMAGLERTPGGYFALHEAVWQDEARGHFLPPHRRALGVVFQEAGLFPHLSVRGNMEFGQRRSHASAPHSKPGTYQRRALSGQRKAPPLGGGAVWARRM